MVNGHTCFPRKAPWETGKHIFPRGFHWEKPKRPKLPWESRETLLGDLGTRLPRGFHWKIPWESRETFLGDPGNEASQRVPLGNTMGIQRNASGRPWERGFPEGSPEGSTGNSRNARNYHGNPEKRFWETWERGFPEGSTGKYHGNPEKRFWETLGTRLPRGFHWEIPWGSRETLLGDPGNEASQRVPQRVPLGTAETPETTMGIQRNASGRPWERGS